MIKKLNIIIKNLIKHPGYLLRLLVPDTPKGAIVASLISRLFNWSEWLRRRRLGMEISSASCGDTIAVSRGYVCFHSDDLALKRALVRCGELSSQINWSKMVGKSNKSFLLSHRLDLFDKNNRCILDLVISDLMLTPIAEYLGSIPVLGSAAIWYSPNTHFTGKSQLFHMDGLDERMVKCFIPIKDVDFASGPLTIIGAAQSRKIFKRMQFSGIAKACNQKFSDDLLFENGADESDLVSMTGTSGDICMVDTCNCYHYGSRQAPKPRLLLFLKYTSAFGRDQPLFGRQVYTRQLESFAGNAKTKERIRYVVSPIETDFEQVVHAQRTKEKCLAQAVKE